MFFLNAFEKLNESEVFKKWKKTNKDSYLSIGCIVFENDFSLPWLLGYYNKKNNKISSFIVDEHLIKLDNEDDVYQEPNSEVLPLNVSKVKIDIQQIMDSVDKLKSEKYKKELVIKYMFVVQNITEFGNVWNATLFTKALNAINFKFNSESGKLLCESSGSLISQMAGKRSD